MVHEGGNAYMIPETNKAGAIRLYIATNFPAQWTLARILVAGDRFVDSGIIKQGGYWWIFTSVGEK